ncbi:MAG TPA: CPBP family intramembrane glutamic endopeptidase [Ktedonosporobacter sp.]|nr:CPBP family intramembrane glutamic endopeptidase [Ktedonosporobacter sp.]
MKLAPTLKGVSLTPVRTGLIILCAGVAWFFAVFIPQPAILAVMSTDPLTALYLMLEHGVLDACFIIAAFYFTAAVLGRRATPTDLGLTRFPFLDVTPTDATPTPWWQTLINAILFLAASLALVILGAFILLIVQGPWEALIHLSFGLTALNNDWGLPGLLQQKPISFGVEVFVLCLLAPFAEEVLFRGFLFQWLARRFNVWAGVLVSALIFTTVHWSIFGFANTALLGIFSALLLRTTRSLWPSVALHSLWNILFVLFALGLLR